MEPKELTVPRASSSTCRSRSTSRTELAAFAASRFARAPRDPAISETNRQVVEMLASSVLTREVEWLRRPSISLDGTPHLVSLKIAKARNDAVRILVEPGHLGMTIAGQIAFSLATLDQLLGLLSWRSAVADVNAVTRVLLPEDAETTKSWWGGMWLGVACLGSAPELRAYFNLRFGTKAERWQRVEELFRVFSNSRVLGRAIEGWIQRLGSAIPVGLGTVLRDGRIAGLRIYVSTHGDQNHVVHVCSPISIRGASALTSAYQDFHRQFGDPPSQAVTIGYDFARGPGGALQTKIGRVKVELCCQMIGPERQSQLRHWIAHRLESWSLDSDPLTTFFGDIRLTWRTSVIDFVSLGFTPDPDHVTVYVKPSS